MQKLPTRHFHTAFVLLLLLLVTAAHARPLAEFTPPGSVLVLDLHQDAPVAPGLGAELAGPRWQQNAATASQVLQAFRYHSDDGSELDPLIELFDSIAAGEETSPYDLYGDLLAAGCPALAPAEPAGQREPFSTGTSIEVLGTIGFAPLNPLPAFTLLYRTDGETARKVSDAVEAGLDCLRAAEDSQVIERSQDGVSLYEVTISLDLNFALAFEQDTLVVSSNPDMVRSTLRLMAGSTEPSLAASPLWQSRERFERGHASLGLTVDLREAATVLGTYRDMITAGDAVGQALFDGAIAALNTAGGFTGHASAVADGILVESLMTVDETAGDAELAALLLGSGRTVGSPPLVPAGALQVTSQVFDLRAFVDYLQGWLDTAADAAGEDRLDLRELSRTELGFDLDTALLDWIGPELHLVRKDPVLSRPLELFFGSGQVLLVPVTSESAARAGLQYLQEYLPQFAELIAELQDLDPSAGELAGIQVAVREREYRGTPITRVQAGPNFDFGYSVLDGVLLAGSPATALEPFIDVHLDGGGAGNPYPFAAGISEPVALSTADLGRDFRSMVETFAPFTQPLASFTQIFLAVADNPGSSRPAGRDWAGHYQPDVQERQPVPVQPGVTQGELTESDGEDDVIYDYWLLEGVNPADYVTVTLTADFDTFLYLFDAETGEVLDANDDTDGDWSTSILTFSAGEGRSLALGATSYWGDETGPYTLEISTRPGAAQTEPVKPESPSYEALLELYDQLPYAGRVFGGRLGELTGWQERDGNTIHSRVLYGFSW